MHRAIIGSGFSNDTRKDRNLTSIFQEGSKIPTVWLAPMPATKAFFGWKRTDIANEVLSVISANVGGFIAFRGLISYYYNWCYVRFGGEQ